jgi:PadR family transcriptional regulator PadR
MARNDPQMTAQTFRVLSTLMGAETGELSGAEIGRVAKLQSGTLYPILMRLEACGWLESRWESEEPQALGRPRRRFYKVTGIGQTRARAERAELEKVVGRLAWA